jgi:hypothetical protein
MVSRAPKARSKVTNGQQLFIDGDARLKVSRRFRNVLASIATNLGGGPARVRAVSATITTMRQFLSMTALQFSSCAGPWPFPSGAPYCHPPTSDKDEPCVPKCAT